ncbi:uncharacterized protein LOC118434052 isoform X2 [Folsomia candida]|uniref:uncharacterized protein LOC118434052 isoform X2 n=1 Tax=Folsomia candida TaxID=158441 RepID=UPI001604F1A4|nr:uncharacterized protein LOC118434052 isoform X2 [Folsomia candida]
MKNTNTNHDDSAPFKHWVKFDMEPMDHPIFGRTHIKSKFPRIPAKAQRPLISDKDFQHFLDHGNKWCAKFWDTRGREDQFQRTVDGCCWFAIYTDPFSDLFSKGMELYVEYNIWVFLVDDALEQSLIEGIDPLDLQKFVQQSMDIFTGKYDTPGRRPQYVEIVGFPYFKSCFDAMLDIHRKCLIHFPWYRMSIPSFALINQRYFDMFIWCSYDKPQSNYSDHIFQRWRGVECANSLCVEFVMMLNAVVIPKRIQEHPCFKKVEDVQGCAGFLNDILGIRKSWLEPDLNSLVGFYVAKDNQSVESAVQKVCDLLEREFRDYLRLKNVLLQQFKDEKCLVDYFDVLEGNLDGNWPMYMYSTRYYAVSNCLTIV